MASDKVQPNTKESPFSFPAEIHHTCKLKVGRILSYYTFDTKVHNENVKPVLYLHGFPSAGLEGAMCAESVAEAGGTLFAPDRAGFGYSDPINIQGREDDQMQAQIEDLWEFVEQQQWKTFSIIAFSGGGPFALAFLTSYLDKRQNVKIPALEAVCLVGAACPSAGTQDMMRINQDFCELVRNKTWWKLKFMFGTQRLAMKILPPGWVLRLFPMTKGLPQVDQDLLLDPQFGTYMVNIQKLALRQGASGAVDEAGVVFRSKQEHEDALKSYFVNSNTKEKGLPYIGIFQGAIDANVPKSHAEYMHHELMNGVPKFVLYEELGHMSLAVRKAKDYTAFTLSLDLDKCSFS